MNESDIPDNAFELGEVGLDSNPAADGATLDNCPINRSIDSSA
jgi:hypothetical protein